MEQLRSIWRWLAQVLGLSQNETRPSAGGRKPVSAFGSSSSRVQPARLVPTGRRSPSVSRGQATTYLERVRSKVAKLAEDFNAGVINRNQFQSLYSYYMREIKTIEGVVAVQPEHWQGAVTEGASILIRRKHMARALGYAIYENESGMPVSALGDFDVEPALLVPMLSSYRAATKEIFGAGMRFTEIEGGRWLCFVPGEFSTLLAVFTNEPAGNQLVFLEELHRTFERANQRLLSNPPVDRSRLLFPHEYYLGQWRQ